MYASFFGLNEKPFSITPDPRYLFLSERHAEALAHLVYGVNEAGGFIQLTGEVGTGKTTVVRSLLAQAPKHAEIALILNPRMTPAATIALSQKIGAPVASAARPAVAMSPVQARSSTISIMPQAWISRTATSAISGGRRSSRASRRMAAKDSR